MIPVAHVIGLSAVLFAIAAFGLVLRRSLLAMLLSVELALNAVALAFVAFNRLWPGAPGASLYDGQVFALLVLTLGVAEVALGLAILLVLHRNRGSLDVEEARLLRW